MKNYFVINPEAGSGKKLAQLRERIERICRDKGVDFEIYITKKIGDATEFVKEKCRSAAEKLRFYACGGDGTLNEVASGAAEFDNAAVGLVPGGTGNDFLRCFKGRESFSDIDSQLNAVEEKIDVVKCGDRYMINMFNTGFDCEVAAKAASLKRLPLISSSLAYILGVVAKFASKPGAEFEVSLDGGEYVKKKLLLATVSNGRFCGGGFKSSPRARLADGLLDICFIKNISRTRFVSIIGKYRSGEYIDMESLKSIVEYCRAERVDIKFRDPSNICVDGEIINTDTISMKVLPKRLSLLVPSGASFAEKELGAEAVTV